MTKKPARCERRDARVESGAQLRRLEVAQARATLLAFTRWTYPRYVVDPAHVALAAELEAVLRGEVTRLMVFAPPQHGKSELVSIRFPAWWLGRHPEDPVILASYAASLAERHSAEARAVVDRKSTRLNSSHRMPSRMPSSA